MKKKTLCLERNGQFLFKRQNDTTITRNMEGSRGKCIQRLRQNWHPCSAGATHTDLAVTATCDHSKQPGYHRSQEAVRQMTMMVIFPLKHLKDPWACSSETCTSKVMFPASGQRRGEDGVPSTWLVLRVLHTPLSSFLSVLCREALLHEHCID